jgi:hypothetical protein
MEGANVKSIDALRNFRAALIKFAEITSSALTDADADVRSTLIWLERDQTVYWSSQIRKRHDALERAKEALRMKQLYKSPTGERQSVVDEMKAVQKAKAALEEAERKLANVKRSIQRLHKQMMEYQGQVQRLMSAAQVDVPAAVAELDRMVGVLDQYVSLRSAKAVASAAEAEGGAMTRAAAGEQGGEVDWAAMRKRTPMPSERAGAQAGLLGFGEWRAGRVKPAQADLLRQIEWPRGEVDTQQVVVAEKGFEASNQVYLQRLEGAFANDSGWVIGNRDAGSPPAARDPATTETTYTLKIEQVLAMRPDLSDILALGVGVLVGLDEQGIAAVLDGDDNDLWNRLRDGEKGETGEASPVE